MDYLICETDELREVSKQLSNHNSYIIDTHQWIGTQVKELGGSWEDMSYEQLASTYSNEATKWLQYLSYCNDDMTRILHEYADRLDAIDIKYAGLFNEEAYAATATFVHKKRGVFSKIGQGLKNAWNATGEFLSATWDKVKEKLSGSAFIGWAKKIPGDTYDYWVTDWDEHKDELALIGGVAICAGSAIWKATVTHNYIGAANDAAKAGYRFAATVENGAAREELLDKDLSDFVGDTFGEKAGDVVEVVTIANKGFRIFSGSGAFDIEEKAADVLFGTGEALSGEGVRDLVTSVLGLDKMNDAYDILNDTLDLADKNRNN